MEPEGQKDSGKAVARTCGIYPVDKQGRHFDLRTSAFWEDDRSELAESHHDIAASLDFGEGVMSLPDHRRQRRAIAKNLTQGDIVDKCQIDKLDKLGECSWRSGSVRQARRMHANFPPRTMKAFNRANHAFILGALNMKAGRTSLFLDIHVCCEITFTQLERFADDRSAAIAFDDDNCLRQATGD